MHCRRWVKIYLPAIDEQEECGTDEVEIKKLRGGSETILLVDDEEALREFGADLLSGWGYHVITASNGREALEIYQNQDQEIALVILDLIMPEMDGKRCLAEILRINPQAEVLIATGYAENGPIPRGELLGAGGVVEKPYTMRKLLQALRGALDHD